MPRCFTVTFNYNHNTYTAVVSQLQDSVCLYLPDESLHYLLPHGRFSFGLERPFDVQVGQRSLAKNLLLVVIAAIEAKGQPQSTNHA